MTLAKATDVFLATALITVFFLTALGVCANNSCYYEARKDAIHEGNSGTVAGGRIEHPSMVRPGPLPKRSKGWQRVDHTRIGLERVREDEARPEAKEIQTINSSSQSA
jgi:hypothetical protein